MMKWTFRDAQDTRDFTTAIEVSGGYCTIPNLYQESLLVHDLDEKIVLCLAQRYHGMPTE